MGKPPVIGARHIVRPIVGNSLTTSHRFPLRRSTGCTLMPGLLGQLEWPDQAQRPGSRGHHLSPRTCRLCSGALLASMRASGTYRVA